MKLLSLLTLALPTASLAHLPQHPLPGSLPVMPPPPPDSDNPGPSIQPSVPLTDILPTYRALTSFSSLTRLHESTSNLLADLKTNTTVLAPLNSAIDALPRKPWEDAREYAALGTQAYDGTGGQERADNNLRKFVEAHLVKGNPWKQGEKMQTLGGRTVWWEEKGGKRIVMPDKVEVDRVASQVANGEVWILKGVLNV